MIQISRKIQLYPTKKQITCFKQACGVARLTYNWALAEWLRQYREDKEYLTFCRQFGVAVYEESLHKPTTNKLDIQFNQIKKVDYPFVYNVPSCIPQQAMKHLNTAFQRFFKGQSGFPQFKKKGRSKSVFHLTNTRFSIEGKTLTVSPFGQIKMSRLLDVEGKIVNGSISERGGKWFLSVTVRVEKPLKTLKPFAIGVDLGIKHLATLSNGEQFDAPRPLKRYLKKIKQLHRELHRRQKGSNNRHKTKTKLARLYYKVACIRQDVLHKLTSYLIEQYGLIAIEDLNVQGMFKNHKLAQASAFMNLSGNSCIRHSGISARFWRQIDSFQVQNVVRAVVIRVKNCHYR